jgi:hypothetical protein
MNLTNVSDPQYERELKDELRRGLEKSLEETAGQGLALDLRHEAVVHRQLSVHAEQGVEKSKVSENLNYL